MLDFLGAGAGPIPLDGQGLVSAGARGTYPGETFSSPSIDLSKTWTDIEIIPGRPGYFPSLLTPASSWIMERIAGSMSTAPSFQAGANAARNNFFTTTASPTVANFNTALGAPALGNGGTGVALATRRIPGQPVYLNVTAGATGTGGFLLIARLVISVFWIASGDT